jgi:uncharacterized glyoxalase superfamily protein PhnB
MIRIANAQVWVHDQDEALAFYTQKLGFEVRQDVTLPEMGAFRWLTVAPAGQDDFEDVLMAIPGPPVFQEDTAEMLREVVSRGVAASIFLNTDDIYRDYETLKARGVTDFTQEPTDHFYGTDMGVRDPFGNAIRILQPAKVAHEATA